MEKQKINRTSELMYDPSEIRVVQRNIAYITGIPINLAKEKVCLFYLAYSICKYLSVLF